MAYTNIDDPSAYFQATTYAGDSNNSTVITNDGNSDLQADLIWLKNRTLAGDSTSSHMLFDSSRGIKSTTGADSPYVHSDSNVAEDTNVKGLQAVSSNGFTPGYMSRTNKTSSNFVAWQWKANGGSLTTVGESGSNPGFTRQTNTDAGYSIIAYTGTGSNGTIAHGLPSTPEMIIFKRRNNANVWATWHQGIGDDYKLVLNSQDAKDSDGAFMNSTLPTSTNITVGGASVNTNADGGTYICYAWSPIQGYSKFGTYEGNADANGPFVYTGFKPAWVMIKNIDNGGYDWAIMDSTRTPTNANGTYEFLWANLSAAEFTDGDSGINMEIDFLSNGFKIRTARPELNLASTFIYMAFAENPFTTSTGVPATAR